MASEESSTVTPTAGATTEPPTTTPPAALNLSNAIPPASEAAQQRRYSTPTSTTAVSHNTTTTNSMISNKYLDPDTVAPPGSQIIDPKTNPLALLAQTCSNIGKDMPVSKPSHSQQQQLQHTELSNSSSVSSINAQKQQQLSHMQRLAQQQPLHQVMPMKRPRAQSPPACNNQQFLVPQQRKSASPSSAPVAAISPGNRPQVAAADAVTNALNALEHAVRGNRYGTSEQLVNQQVLNELLKTQMAGSSADQISGPPSKMMKPSLPNGSEQIGPSAITSQLLQLANQTPPNGVNHTNKVVGQNSVLPSATPLNNSSNANIRPSPVAPNSVDQQQLYTAYLTQLMRSYSGQQQQQQPPPQTTGHVGVSPLPPTPPPHQQQQAAPNHPSTTQSDIWSMVLQSYSAKQQQQLEQHQQPQKLMPIRPQPRSSTPSTFVCNWLSVGTFCGKKFTTKEALVEHVSLAHASTSGHSNEGEDSSSFYHTILQGYLASLASNGGSAPKAATISPPDSRSENSPSFPLIPSANACQKNDQQVRTLQQFLSSMASHNRGDMALLRESPPSPPRQHVAAPVANGGAQPPAGIDQTALVASFIHQFTSQQQPAAMIGGLETSFNSPFIENPSNFYARQQRNLQAAVLAAASKSTSRNF